MPDDDALLGQNEVDVRNEARRPFRGFTCGLSSALAELTPAEPDDETINELWHSINHLRRLQEAESVSPAAELRRQESIDRTRQEIARLMRSGT